MDIQPYILIGGDSKRFGRDKATFEFEGETLAARALRMTEAAFPDRRAKFVSKQPGVFLDRQMLGDVYLNRGSAAGIHTALVDTSTRWVFVLACDLPYVTPDFILTLTNFVDVDHDCVVPVQADGRWQVLCALYNVARCLPAFENSLAEEGRHPSIRAICETLQTRAVEFSVYKHLKDAERLLKNANTLGDLTGI